MEEHEHEKDPLALPSPDVLRDIAARQDAKAREIAEKKKQQKLPNERDNAARLIQKSYRGYRERRALQGYALDPDARWMEV